MTTPRSARNGGAPVPGRATERGIPEATVARLPVYLRILTEQADDGVASLLRAGAFSDRDSDQLVHLATDGESYGHHHRFGEMALAYALQIIEATPGARVTNYGEMLELQARVLEALQPETAGGRPAEERR